MSTELLDTFMKSGKRTQGIILTTVGFLVCFLGFLFASSSWSSGRSFLSNIGSAKVEIIKGEHVLVEKASNTFDGYDFGPGVTTPSLNFDRYETRGRVAVPLKYILAVGIIIAGVGISLIYLDSGEKPVKDC